MRDTNNKLIKFVRSKACLTFQTILFILANFGAALSQPDGIYDLIYRQDFTEETTQWNLEPVEDEWAHINYSIKDGEYRWEISFKKDASSHVTPNSKIYLPEDGYLISVETGFESDNYDCASGILFNYQDSSNFYFARLSASGKADIYAKYLGDWFQIGDSVQSEYFYPTGMNKITVINKADNFELQINNVHILNFTDNRFHGGRFGLLAEGSEGIQTSVRFDNLEVMKKEVPFDQITNTAHHLRSMIGSMNNLYPLHEGEKDSVDYSLDIHTPINEYKIGNGELLCLKESMDRCCIFILQHSQDESMNLDSHEFGDKILEKYAEQMVDFKIIYREKTSLINGYPVYKIRADFSVDEQDFESNHMFIQTPDSFFQIMIYEPRELNNTCDEDLNRISESFSLMPVNFIL